MIRQAKRTAPTRAPVGCHHPSAPQARASLAAIVAAVAAAMWLGLPAPTVMAEDGWNPFAEQDRRRAARRLERQRDPGPRLEPFDIDDVGPGRSGARRFGERTDGTRSDRAFSDRRPSGRDRTGRSADRRAASGTPFIAPQPPQEYVPPVEPGRPIIVDDAVAVKRRDLAPIVVPESSGRRADASGWTPRKAAGPDVWAGVSADAMRQLITATPSINRSSALRDLKRVALANGTVPADDAARDALRAETLYRWGLLHATAAPPPAAPPAGANTPTLIAAGVAARNAVVRDGWAAACGLVRPILGAAARMPKALRGQLLIIGGGCAAHAGNASGAELAAGLTRDSGYQNATSLTLLDAIASGARRGDSLSLAKLNGLDARLLELAGARPDAKALADAEPSALATLATSREIEPVLRIAAAERAAARGLISGADLGAAYETAKRLRLGDRPTRATERARQWVDIDTNRSHLQRARAIRGLLDSARKDGLYVAALEMSAAVVRDMPRIPEIGWFAETAIETLVAAGDTDTARRWSDFADTLDATARDGYDHWRALIDLADQGDMPLPARERFLPAVEAMVAQRRFSPVALHRLATVINALGINTPLGIWNAANATPQPTDGFLPETGVLPALARASRGKSIGETALLAAQAIGPRGATDTNILALGDTIRALRRAGLNAFAHRVAIEAVLESWPRSSPS